MTVKTPRQSLDVVRHWMQHNGDIPHDRDFQAAVEMLMCDWKRDRWDGFDVLALAALDEIVETLTAMRDMI